MGEDHKPTCDFTWEDPYWHYIEECEPELHDIILNEKIITFVYRHQCPRGLESLEVKL